MWNVRPVYCVSWLILHAHSSLGVLHCLRLVGWLMNRLLMSWRMTLELCRFQLILWLTNSWWACSLDGTWHWNGIPLDNFFEWRVVRLHPFERLVRSLLIRYYRRDAARGDMSILRSKDSSCYSVWVWLSVIKHVDNYSVCLNFIERISCCSVRRCLEHILLLDSDTVNWVIFGE